jgi:DNA-binding SARP family transcriptional activator/Flp pilus assembly protein TadD
MDRRHGSPREPGPEPAGGLEFRVLGPLEVWRDGALVPVTAGRQRAVLAALLLRANQVLAAERLIDLLWGGRPPATARNTLQTLVRRLRRQLAPDEATGPLLTQPPGYLLRVDPDRLDLARFERLLRHGREALAAGDHERAAALLDEAVGLWRGPALSDVSADLLRPEEIRLQELYQQAVEERVEARLRQGRHAELVAEVRALVAEHPLRERPYGQLMRALYGSGRQAEALETYRALRRLLADELRVEPGPELQQLHVAMLRGDAEIDPSRGSQAPSSPPARLVPAQLPVDTAAFTGRAEPLRRLDKSVHAGGVVAVVGTAGVGKTALVVHWAHQAREQFPDGQLYLDLQGYATVPALRPIDALGQFLRALGLPADQIPTDPQEAAAAFRSLLADRRALVVLDNARTADQVRPLLPGGSGCLVLVTSRDRLDGLLAREGALRLRLEALPPADARALLARTVGGAAVAGEPEAADELAGLCCYLPLALRIAAANLGEGGSVAGYAARLRAGNQLSQLSVAGDAQTAVRAAFDLSYAALPEPARRVFRLLGGVPVADLTTAAAAALAGVTPAQAACQLDVLAAAHLVHEAAPGRFTCHDLLRHYAAELSAAMPEAAAAAARLHGWYLATVDAAARLLYPDRMRLPVPAPAVPPPQWADSAAALAWLEAERRNLVLAVQHAAQQGPRATAWLLADALRGYFAMRRHLVDWLAAAQAGLAAAEADGDLTARAAAEFGMAEAQLRHGHRPAAIAHYLRSVEFSERAGWVVGQACALGNLGTVYQQSGRPVEAAEHYARSVRLSERAGRPEGQAAGLLNLGIACWELGRLEEAAEHCAQALRGYESLGLTGGRAYALGNLGAVYLAQGRLEQARAHLEQALPLYREMGDRGPEADAVRCLAEVHRDAGRPEPALRYARQALALARDAHDLWLEAFARNTLSSVLLRTGQPRQAITGHQHALRLAREIGNQEPQAYAHVGLAAAYRELGQADLAAAEAGQALTLARHNGYRLIEERALALLSGSPPARPAGAG